MALDFYYAPYSSASPAQWAIEELAVPCRKIKIDLKGTTHRSAEYLALNPNGKVPLLVVDGTPLFESIAILYYLGDRFGVEKGLWPSGQDPARLHAMSWTAWANTELGAAAVRYLHAAAHGATEAAATAARAQIEANFAILETRLDARSYVLGESFSLVDVPLASATGWIQHSMNVDLAPFPRVQAWAGRCQQRPAFAAAMAS